MSSAPWLETDVSLKALNTFGLPATARRLARIRGDADVRRVLDSPEVGRSAKLVLGGGSNLVLTRDIDEVVLKVEVGGLRLGEARGGAWAGTRGARARRRPRDDSPRLPRPGDPRPDPRHRRRGAGAEHRRLRA